MATKRKKNQQSNTINLEAKAIGMIALAFLFALSIYSNASTGSFGGIFKALFVGLFGVGGFLVPILLFSSGVYIFLSKKNIEKKVLILSSIIFLLFIALANLFSGNTYNTSVSTNFFIKRYQSATFINGGFFGGFIGDLFKQLLGKIGAILILIFSMLVSILLLSNKSLSDLFYLVIDKMKNPIDDEYIEEDIVLNEKIIAKPIAKQAVIKNEEKKVEKDFAKRNEQLKRKKIALPPKATTINMRRNKSNIKKNDVRVIDINDIDQDFTQNEYQSIPFTIAEDEIVKTKNPYIEEIEKDKEIIDSLKEELKRQSYLFQETQRELIEQKNTEKSLLKIINAQRDTIDKLTVQLKIATAAHQLVNQSIQKADEVSVFEEKEIKIFEEQKEQEVIEIKEVIEEKEIKEDPISNIFNNGDAFYDTLSDIDYSQIDEVTPDDETVFLQANDNVFEKPLKFEENNESSLNLKEIELMNATLEGGEIEEVSSLLDNEQTLDTFEMIDEEDHKQVLPRDILPKEKYVYAYPTVDFLNQKPKIDGVFHSKTELLENSKKLEATLKSFGVVAKVVEVNKGPTVTRYEVQPGLGVKVSKIANLSDDLALNLAAKGIRIQAPIPGKAAVGIEVPNETTDSVYLREVLDDENFREFPSKIAFGMGKDIAGKIVVADLAKMPHLLIAGATGSGKSVCINTIITSIIYKSTPDEVKLLMIDPKVVELSVYNGIPHLLIPVVTDPKKASSALHWAVREMEKRYKLFADNNVRDLKGYNQNLIDNGIDGIEPQIVIIIDELADLMMTAAKEVEDAIMRLAAMARAAGIHLIIATQRPSVDVITGVIKSNIPSRLAFAVSSGIDSKTILDSVGAEKLLGKGDMLFSPAGASEPMRIQGAFISDKEVESIVNFLKTDVDHDYMKEIIEDITSGSTGAGNLPNDKVDELLEDVVEFIIQRQKASTSLIQRQFRVGFNRAARIVEELENFGVIGQDEGNKPRRVLMTMEEWDRKFKV